MGEIDQALKSFVPLSSANTMTTATSTPTQRFSIHELSHTMQRPQY